MNINELKHGMIINVERRHKYNNGYADSDRVYQKKVLIGSYNGHPSYRLNGKVAIIITDETGNIITIHIGRKAKYVIS